MKIAGFVFLAAFLLCPPFLKADPLLQLNDRVAIYGGSISSYLEDCLLMTQPVAGLDIEQFNWVAQDPAGLLARLDADVLPYKPTVMLLGFNSGVNTPPAKLQTDLTALVDALKKAGVRTIVIGSPECVDSTHYQNDPAKAAAENKTRAAIADIDKSVAAQEGVVYADVYGDTMAAMTKVKAQQGENYNFGGTNTICVNLVSVYSFLKALKCDDNVGTVTIDYAAGTATGTPGQNIVSFQDNTALVSSTRQPFHFPAYASGRPDPDPIMAAVPFNNEVNRYVLVVKNLPTAQTKIYWGGDENRDYSSAELAKGVNLTGDMLNRVFAPQSENVNGGVWAQEHQEQLAGEALLKGQPDPQADAKHEAALLVAKNRVAPVQFKIRVQPLAVPDPWPKGPIPVIVDTDMDGDIDDVAALALINDFMDQGECTLLACLHDTANTQLSSCATIQAINTYYGHPNIPIGQAYAENDPAIHRTSILAPAPADGYHTVPGPYGSTYTLKIHQRFDPTFPNDDKMPPAVDVYRKALASAADGSVVICSIGNMQNIQDLLLSQPDSVSNLSGLDLVRKKVREVVIMFNTVPQDHFLLGQWPVKVMWSIDIGNYLSLGASLINTPENNPVRIIFHGDRRQGWDPTAAWLAVRGTGDVYDVIAGRPSFLNKVTHSPPGPYPNEMTATVKMRSDKLNKLFDDELARPPKY